MSASTTWELFAWMEREPDGNEGIVAAMIPGTGTGTIAPLCHRDRCIADLLRPLAEAHARAANRPLRLVRFVRAQTIEEIP